MHKNRRSMRYHQRPDSDEEFETPAFQDAVERNEPRATSSDDSDELQSESGLGESPEEDLINEALPDSDNNDEDTKGDHHDSDSDSAPEEVSFAKSREAEEKRLRTIMGEIRKGRNEEKEWRRKRDELFKLQKKEKLVALKKRKLPEELLGELSQLAGKKKKTDQDKNDAEEDTETLPQEKKEKDLLGSGLDEEEVDSDEGEAGSADFLPLSNIQEESIQVVSLHPRKGQSNAVSQKVIDFKQAMLYGGRHKRQTSQQSRMQKAKRLARR